MSNAKFDLEINRGGNHRLGEDQHIFQADYHYKVREDLAVRRKQPINQSEKKTLGQKSLNTN